MTPAEVAARAPRSWRIYVMRVEQRMGLGPIASKLGITKAQAVNGAKRAAELLAMELPSTTLREPQNCRKYLGMKDGPRCRCGLLRPCLECLPPTYAVASQRNGESVGLF